MLPKIYFLHIGRNAWQTREHVFNAEWPSSSSSARNSRIVTSISRGNVIEGMRITVTVVRLSVCGSEIVLVSVGLVSLRLGFD